MPGPVRPTRFHESNGPRTDKLEPEQSKRRLPHQDRRILIRHSPRAFARDPRTSAGSPVAVTGTTTPSGSGGIELEHMEHMEHGADPSRCATTVPQDQCSGSVPPDHDAGPKPMTCANTAWRHRPRNDDLRIENEQTALSLTMWHKMCHMARLKDGLVGE